MMNALTTLAIGFFVCLGLCLVAIRIAPALGLLDIPGGRRQHKGHIPRVGGLALAISLLLLSAFSMHRPSLTRIEAGAVVVMAVLGFLDDRLDLRARWKAMMGFFVALILASSTLHHLNLPPYLDLVSVSIPSLPWISFALLTVMYLCLPHGFNLIDGANGLATGFALVVLGSLWAKGFPHPALVGGLIACLILNWPSARLFLGDCGSLSIGLLLVVFAQKALIQPEPNHLMWLFAYPTLDVVMVMAIRSLIRKPIMVGDRNHLHYQIGDRWPRLAKFSVPILLAISAMCGSEIYLTGGWRVIPYTGLSLLIGAALFFTYAGVAQNFRSKETETEIPSPALLDPDGSHLEPKILHPRAGWQGNVIR